jgi:RNA polymerase sigma factor (sigma-70 family)
VARDICGISRLYYTSLFQDGTLAGLTDGQLLERFATRRGDTAELAFATLVERHGRMVLRTCRGILRDEHEAMDAFQATFLVLVRKGHSLWVRDSLGPWLHRVACRAAQRARADAVRRRSLEYDLAAAAVDRSNGDDRDSLAAVVHEEVDRLPDRYRVPIVLCDLEGRTCEDAARHLGCPVGTIGSRLARGRERLRGRLARRGLSPGAGALIAAISAESRVEAMPTALAEFAARLGMCAEAGKTGAGASSAASVRLAEDILRSFHMTKFTLIGAATVAVVSLTLTASWALGHGDGAQDPPGKVAPAAQAGRQRDLKQRFPFMDDNDRNKDAVYAEMGNIRPVIQDENGVRFQNREAILYKDGTAKLWRLDQKDPIAPPLRHKQPIRELAFLGHSNRLVTTSDDSVKVWDALSGELRKELDGQTIRPLWLLFSTGSDRFVTIDAARMNVTVWDAEKLTAVATVRAGEVDRIAAAGPSRDGKSVVIFRFGAAPATELWDIASGRLYATLRPPSPAVAEMFVDGGTRLNESQLQFEARLWDVVRTLAPAGKPQYRWIRSVYQGDGTGRLSQ